MKLVNRNANRNYLVSALYGDGNIVALSPLSAASTDRGIKLVQLNHKSIAMQFWLESEGRPGPAHNCKMMHICPHNMHTLLL